MLVHLTLPVLFLRYGSADETCPQHCRRTYYVDDIYLFIFCHYYGRNNTYYQRYKSYAEFSRFRRTCQP